MSCKDALDQEIEIRPGAFVNLPSLQCCEVQHRLDRHRLRNKGVLNWSAGKLCLPYVTDWYLARVLRFAKPPATLAQRHTDAFPARSQYLFTLPLCAVPAGREVLQESSLGQYRTSLGLIGVSKMSLLSTFTPRAAKGGLTGLSQLLPMTLNPRLANAHSDAHLRAGEGQQPNRLQLRCRKAEGR